ncbi:hypothetical protein VTK26DRAFT_1887 [Humicola hyalothermophila]
MRTISNSWTAWSTTLLLSSPAAALVPVHPRLLARQADPTAFDWSAITPTPDLQYHDCYGAFKCARLQVPLDWSSTGGGLYTNSSSSSPPNQKHAAIAILTLPAAVPPSSPLYGGPVLVNPGGPGGPGTSTVLGVGPIIQGVTDTPEVRHFDIVGFDPRGVGFSTPRSACYASDFDRFLDMLQDEGRPSLLTEAGLQAKWAAGSAMSALCRETSEADGEGTSIFEYMNTATVARDMLAIVDAAEEWRVKNGGERKKEKPRLQYLGFSYGTVLGNTFASMFPGRVGKMVVDGISDAEDYMSGVYGKVISDSELSIDKFYETCFAAGQECPLRKRGDRSARDIRRRVDHLIKTLQHTPASTVHNGRVTLISSLVISEAIRASLYDPINKYHALAQQLADAVDGNFNTFLSSPNLTLPGLPNVQQPELCTAIPPSSPAAYTWPEEAVAGILCGDSQGSPFARYDRMSWARSIVSRMTSQSPTVGEAWARVSLSCIRWPFTPRYTFKGPWGSPAPDPKRAESTPASPLLVLSTRIDHATPLRNAVHLTHLHKGSSLVIQEGVGHCALLASVSQCTYGVVRDYFATGKVPPNGTVCEPEPECVPSIPWRECPGYVATM